MTGSAAVFSFSDCLEDALVVWQLKLSGCAGRVESRESKNEGA